MIKIGDLCSTCVFDARRHCVTKFIGKCNECPQAELVDNFYMCKCLQIGYGEDCPYYVLAEQETEGEE